MRQIVRPGRGRTGFVVGAIVLACGRIAVGDEARVRFRGFEGCPDEASFVRDVMARVHASGDDSRTFAVAAARRGPKVVGTIEVSDRRGRKVRRELSGGSCAEVSSALALVVALAIDPRASLAPTPPASTASTAAPPSAPPPEAPPTPERAPVVEAPAAESAPIASTTAAPALTAPRVDSDGGWTVGVDGIAHTSVAPSPAPGAAVFVERWQDTLAGRVSGVWATRDVAIPSGGRARFRYLGARAVGCPWSTAPAPSTRLRACAGFDLGALHAEGLELADPRSATRFFPAALGLGRATWAFAPPVSAEVAVGAVVPLVRDEFVVDGPRSEVHTPGRVGGTLEIGVGVGFR